MSQFWTREKRGRVCANPLCLPPDSQIDGLITQAGWTCDLARSTPVNGWSSCGTQDSSTVEDCAEDSDMAGSSCPQGWTALALR